MCSYTAKMMLLFLFFFLFSVYGIGQSFRGKKKGLNSGIFLGEYSLVLHYQEMMLDVVSYIYFKCKWKLFLSLILIGVLVLIKILDKDLCNYRSSLEFWFENRPDLNLKHN